ncbi:MAG: hypothetical protein ABIN96_14655, partial [Rubrivivax sp.]
GPGGELPLPWLAQPLADMLTSQRGHALLVHGAAGVGALAFVLTLAQAWLCEGGSVGAGEAEAAGSARATRPCGRCASCRLVQNHLHPDLRVLLPETLRRAHRWPLAEDKPEGEDKRKPSRQIRIDEVRSLIDWSTRTSARGRGKVGVMHPAEAMNATAASALLKTLEEPPAGTRLLLTCADPALLLPTVVSRCQRLRLSEPADAAALAWLLQQGVDRPQVLLAACSGRPLDALELSGSGVDADAWSALPVAVAQGRVGVFSGWPVPRAIDALQKLCHDALARAVGGQGRFFGVRAAASASVGQPSIDALLQWQRALQHVARHAEHPWNEPLLLDALVQEAATALSPPATSDVGSTDRMATLRR